MNLISKMNLAVYLLNYNSKKLCHSEHFIVHCLLNFNFLENFILFHYLCYLSMDLLFNFR